MIKSFPANDFLISPEKIIICFHFFPELCYNVSKYYQVLIFQIWGNYIINGVRHDKQIIGRNQKENSRHYQS